MDAAATMKMTQRIGRHGQLENVKFQELTPKTQSVIGEDHGSKNNNKKTRLISSGSFCEHCDVAGAVYG
jgi:hypothetical protein